MHWILSRINRRGSQFFYARLKVEAHRTDCLWLVPSWPHLFFIYKTYSLPFCTTRATEVASLKPFCDFFLLRRVRCRGLRRKSDVLNNCPKRKGLPAGTAGREENRTDRKESLLSTSVLHFMKEEGWFPLRKIPSKFWIIHAKIILSMTVSRMYLQCFHRASYHHSENKSRNCLLCLERLPKVFSN